MATVGGSDNCGPQNAICNGPLVPGAMYSFRYRLFSGLEFQDYSFESATFMTGELEKGFSSVSWSVAKLLMKLCTQ